ncbi:hypothetical protein BDN72DRAFT_430142 [Pluteus cervinus]|uniref:Uncharacterized protein n=1 Tax=Pluteus cervinus TaxID=181527 RepID=A0ACD3A799_9AGAR|nr:hypothetical protein BDN72DRAFT_430142 [Pluteus cervinus]
MPPPIGGVYKIISAQCGLSLDLSGSDQKSIIGYEWHGGRNQQWFVDPQPDRPDTFIILNGSKPVGLSFEGNPGDGVPVVAIEEPGIWVIRPDGENPSAFSRIFVPDTPFNLELPDEPVPESPVTLFGQSQPGINQTWLLERV